VTFLAISATCVILSFWPSRTTYWAAIISFSTITIALPLFIAFGFITAVGIGVAFSGGTFPMSAIIILFVICGYFVASGLSLYPFITLRMTKKIGIICFAIILPLILVFAVCTSQWPISQIAQAINHAYFKEALIFFLVWLRIYDLKKAVKSINTPLISLAHGS
jgi:hypothetical protein